MRIDQTSFFEKIRQNSVTRWNQLESDPELAAPWWQLFKQVQSPRHVLSELLQNADDAGATWAKAKVDDDVFTFEHNGADFEEEHLASLCKFGQSNKRQLHTIGFRGIGFKSTFSLGDIVNVSTPSLSFYFSEKRFTQPEWDKSGLKTDHIIISVVIADEDRMSALLENLKDWVLNPGALLFFHNIQELNIDDYYKIRSEKRETGPVKNSTWYDLYTVEKKYNVLLVRSKAQKFSSAAIDEVRKERMDDTVELPPASVDIVLGLPGEQKIYTVLPTDVRTKLPFSCNGPFIQDPARTGLKDPSLSPVNRWLLEECGKLAAKTMLGWLNNDLYDLKEKCKAYKLLTPHEIEITSISHKVTDQVSRGFGVGINNQKIFLSSEGSVKYGKDIFSLPKEIYSVWGANDLIYLFGKKRKFLLSSVVSESSIYLLYKWDDALDKKVRNDIQLYLINSHHVPKPNSLEGLLSLWVYFDDSVTKLWFSREGKELKIIPVEGKNYLTSVENVFRLSKDIDAECVGRVLDGFVDLIDSKWLRVLNETIDRAQTQGNQDFKLFERIRHANSVLNKLNLNQASPFSEIVSDITKKLNAKYTTDHNLLVEVTKLFARLDVNVGKDFPYVCNDGNVRKIQDHILYKPTAKALKLIPEKWLKSHELSNLYDDKKFDCCNEQEWQKWAFSGKGGLRKFIRPELHKQNFYSKGKLQKFYSVSGLNETPKKKISTDAYTIHDYDFSDDVWSYWERLSLKEPDVWSNVILELIRDTGELPVEVITPMVFQQGTTKLHLLDHIDGLAATWVVKMRELPSLLDTYSIHHKPANLLMRTNATEPLHGIEPFVHQDYDIQKATTLLTVLGVNNTPPGVNSLLSRLRVAPNYDEPPVADLVGWYRGIDSIVAKFSEEELKESGLIEIFQTEELIFTEERKWCRSSDVFLEKDNEAQEEPVVSELVRNLPFWVRVGVERRLTTEHIISKLKSLEFGSTLFRDMLITINRWISKSPHRVLREVKGWVSLKGSWESIDSFNWYSTDKNKSTGLFPEFLRGTVDFSFIDLDQVDVKSLGLSNLSKHLDYKVKNVVSISTPERVDWICTIGELIERIVSEVEGLKNFGNKLKNTSVQLVKSIDVVPFLDSKPAGVVSQPKFYWHEELLYVTENIAPKNAEEIDDELSKTLEDPELRNAVRICLMRNKEFIIEYFDANFFLSENVATDQDEGNEGSRLEAAVEVKDIDPVSENDGTINIIDNDESFEQNDEIEIEIPYEDIISDSGLTEINDNEKNNDNYHVENEPDDQVMVIYEEDETEENNHKETITKTKVLESYVLENGYRKSSYDDCYRHENGTRICKSEDIFSYEKLDSTGNIDCFYYIATTNFEKGITVPPEVYNYLTKHPKNVSFLVHFNGMTFEVSGENIKSDVGAGIINVFPKSYLLRSNDD